MVQRIRVPNNEDLHPEDTLIRVALREVMLGIFSASDLPERVISERAGHGSGWARSALTKESWKLATMMALARSLSYTMTFNVVPPRGVTPEPEDAAFAATMDMFARKPHRADEAARLRLRDLGRRIRVASGLSVTDMGRLLNMKAPRVSDWEDGDADDCLLLTAQRYFRGLGGKLVPVLVAPSGDIVFPVSVSSGGSVVLPAAGKKRKAAKGTARVLLPQRLRGDGPCADCGTADNIHWSTDSVFWNEVEAKRKDQRDGDGIVCVPCFVARVDEAGFRPTGWRLVPEFHWETRVESARRVRGTANA